MGCKSIRKTSGQSEPCLPDSLLFLYFSTCSPYPSSPYKILFFLSFLIHPPHPSFPTLSFPTLSFFFLSCPSFPLFLYYFLFPFLHQPPGIPVLSFYSSLSLSSPFTFCSSRSSFSYFFIVIYSFLDLLLFAHFIFSFSSDHKFPQCS